MNKDNIEVATRLKPETIVRILDSIVDDLQYYGAKEEYEAIMLLLEEYGFKFR